MGQKDSNLEPWACNASLLRRKELGLMGHVELLVDGRRVSPRDLFKGGYQVAFGVPNMGKVCTEAHVPSFVAAAPQLKELGIRLPVICLAQASPDEVAKWQQGLGLDTSLVQPVVDVGGRLTRFLGLNFPGPSADGGPKSMRWAALIDHGVLLQTLVEKSPADLTVSSGEEMVKLVQKTRAVHEDLSEDSA